MSGDTKATLRERNESLWRLVVSPTIWATHFMLSYVTAAIWCARYTTRDGSLAPVRTAIIVYTVLALAGIAWNGWNGWRRHRFGDAAVPHDDDTPEDRHRFMGFATMLLASLSAVATIYASLVVVFVRTCR